VTATQILQARLHRLEGFQRKKLVATGPIHASSNAMANGRLFELTAEAGALTVAFVAALPRSLVFYELGGQLLASGTSTEANDRAAQRARSPAEFEAKLKIVEEEADECLVWIDRLRSARLPTTQRPTPNGSATCSIKSSH
jgi:four helix bundle protein